MVSGVISPSTSFQMVGNISNKGNKKTESRLLDSPFFPLTLKEEGHIQNTD